MRLRCLLFLICSLAAAQDNVEAVLTQARDLKAKGDAAGALAAFQQAGTLDPQSAAIQDDIGFLLAVLQRKDEALAKFQHALELDAKYAPAHFHLGVAY